MWLLLTLGCASQPAERLPISQGTGGPTGRVAATHVDDRGRGGAYVMDVPADAHDDPYGLLLFFHADGEQRTYDAQLDWVSGPAAAHHLIPVSMQEPDRTYWWAPVSEDNSHYVGHFVDTLMGQYPLDPNRVYVAGKSGGASFAAGWHHSVDFSVRGGAVALCGADRPRLNVENPRSFDYDFDDPPPAPVPTVLDAGVLSSVGFYFAISRSDFLVDLSVEAAEYYEAMGFADVHHVFVQGRGHCGFDVPGELATGMDVLAE